MASPLSRPRTRLPQSARRSAHPMPANSASLPHRVPASRLAGRRWSRPHVLVRGEPVGDDLGAFHAAELPFVFDALDRPLGTMPSPGTASAFLQVREEMMAAGRVRAHPILGCSATPPRSHLQGYRRRRPLHTGETGGRARRLGRGSLLLVRALRAAVGSVTVLIRSVVGGCGFDRR